MAWTGVGLCGLLAASGCEDPKQRIAMLEEENRSLYADLDTLRAGMASIKQQRDRCENDLLTLQGDNNDLRGRLSATPQQVDMPGQWQAVPGGAMIAIPGSVLFSSGKVTLKQDSKSVMSRIASEIQSNFSGKDIYVFGHTDTDPIKKSKWQDNRQLSSERALAVVRHLQSQGVSPASLVACGCGEHRPATSNKSTSGRAKNRRVEIFAVDPAMVASR
jgi:chemotaxis protein MotB